MTERWYQNAIIYCLDAEAFQDSDGDGAGDFAGLTHRLDYLARLGIDCLWLTPDPSLPGPRRRLRHHRLLQRASPAGHTWRLRGVPAGGGQPRDPGHHRLGGQPHFGRAPRGSGPRVPPRTRLTRDWYVWSEQEGPADRRQGMVFPGEQKETWTCDKTAGAWYYHPFYRFQPDLNISNPRVRDEIKKIASFWLQLRGGRVPDGRGAVPHRKHQSGRQHGR